MHKSTESFNQKYNTYHKSLCEILFNKRAEEGGNELALCQVSKLDDIFTDSNAKEINLGFINKIATLRKVYKFTYEDINSDLDILSKHLEGYMKPEPGGLIPNLFKDTIKFPIF